MANQQLKIKKTPERRCTGCGEGKPKKELLRIVRSPEGEISIDLTGKSPGRGAYICKSEACLKNAKKTGRLGRSLNAEIPDDVFQRLVEEINAAKQ